MRFTPAVLWLTALFVLGGCPSEPEKKPQLGSITVECAPASVIVGQTAQCTASARDQDGQSFTVSSYTWSSSNTAVATVDAAGKVTTVTVGTTTLTASATADGISRQGEASLAVERVPPALSAVTVACTPTSVIVGQTAQCTASARDQYGQPFPVSNYTWSSSDTAVAMVDATGKATTLGVGSVELKASATVSGSTQQGQASLTVERVPPALSVITVTCSPSSVIASRTAQCAASAKDQYGQPFPVSSYTWSSSNETVATVDSTGKVTTLKGGNVNLIAQATEAGVTQQGQATLQVIQPTLHETAISASETWRASDNPHLVRGDIVVDGAGKPTLTIEAGAEIYFSQNARLRFTQGVLRAMGTSAAPIRMSANQSTPTKGYWQGIYFETAGSDSEMNYVTMSDCARSFGGSAIAMMKKAAPVLRYVTLQNIKGTGVTMVNDGSAFGPGSTTLSISDSDEDYIMRVNADQVDTIPTGGTFTRNPLNVIALTGTVTRSQTWANIGPHYSVQESLQIEGSSTPKLTLAAGVVVEFENGTGLYVGENGPGELIVNGTAPSPVRFTQGLYNASSPTPTPGSWRGVHLKSKSSSASKLSHAVIEYAGYTGSEDGGTGNLNVYGNGAGGGASPVLNDVLVRMGSKYGVYLTAGGTFGTGSTLLNVNNNGSYAISLDANSAGTLPTGGTFSGNTRDAVEIRTGDVTTTQTWPNLGIPYVVNHLVNVGSADGAKLTLPAGTELRFGQGQGLIMGSADGTKGILEAYGTGTKPIRFVPDTATPTKGYWRGLHFWNSSSSILFRTVITHGGAPGSIGTGNVNVYWEISILLDTSTVSDSSGCGITVSDGTRPGTQVVTTDHTAYDVILTNNDGGPICKN